MYNLDLDVEIRTIIDLIFAHYSSFIIMAMFVHVSTDDLIDHNVATVLSIFLRVGTGQMEKIVHCTSCASR